jgi:flavin-dependent dehydrogenase
LPRLLNLEKPSSFPPRKALFTHVIDHIDDDEYDRNKILICVNPENRAIWYWLIPFSNGTVSLGVVGEPKFIDSAPGENLDKLKSFVVAEPRLRELLRNAEYHTRVGEITGYAADVDSLHGPGYALLGNAGEFLDPVFSSGVTIAMRSGHLAAHLLEKQFSGETVDWVSDYDQALRLGIKTFKNFVTTWYDGSFQDVIFGVSEDTDVKKMICSILAGYAWDTRNPYVSESDKRLRVLTELCRSE